MNLRSQSYAAGSARRPTRAHTLPEMMVGISIFSMLTLGLLSLQMFGLRQDQLVQSKLGASDESRRAFGKLLSEIRGSTTVRVGNGSASTFTPIAVGTVQQGTALQIYPTAATNTYIRYYFDPANYELRRIASGVAGSKAIATHLTNNLSFWAEDFKGVKVKDNTFNYVIRTTLEFYQYQYPLTKVGPGYLYDYYRLDLRATRRN